MFAHAHNFSTYGCGLGWARPRWLLGVSIHGSPSVHDVQNPFTAAPRAVAPTSSLRAFNLNVKGTLIKTADWYIM